MKGPRPVKICPACLRPFEWRKKWERDWENVVYCSKKCVADASRSRAAAKRAP